MSTIDNVLAALTQADAPVSGEWLARKLGVSRNSVWKAIGQLRREGYTIEAATNRGYRLVDSPDRISVAGIGRWLKPGAIGSRIELHRTLDSTNTRAKAIAATGAPHGYLVIAESQTGGKGRMGRAFFSPEHSGVYITYADVQVGIKWVNDLYINRRTVCGILCEASMDFESGQLEYAVLGIGVNVAAMEFPEELRDIATSIANECGQPVSRNRLIAEISNQLNALYGQLESLEFMTESRSRSIVIGRDVQVIRGGVSFPAKVLDIDDQDF